MSDPLDTLIKSRPTAAVVTVPAAAGNYTPGADFVPAAGEVVTPLEGLFWKVSAKDGQNLAYEAILSVRLADLADAGTPERTRVLVLGVNYFAADIRKRMWKGAQNGWTFELRQ